MAQCNIERSGNSGGESGGGFITVEEVAGWNNLDLITSDPLVGTQSMNSGNYYVAMIFDTSDVKSLLLMQHQEGGTGNPIYQNFVVGFDGQFYEVAFELGDTYFNYEFNATGTTIESMYTDGKIYIKEFT